MPEETQLEGPGYGSWSQDGKTCKLKFHLCQFLAVWTWVGQVASLSLNFHICK